MPPGAVAGADLLEGVDHVQPLTPSHSPDALHQAAELPQGRGRPPGEVGWGWGTPIGGARNGKPGAVRGGRVTWTYDGGGVRAGAQGCGNSGSGALGGHGGALGSGSGASQRLRRSGAARSLRAGGGSDARGGERERRRRRDEASLPGALSQSGGGGGTWGASSGAAWYWGGRSAPLSTDLPRRGGAPGEVDAAAVVAGGTGRVVVPAGDGPGASSRATLTTCSCWPTP